MSKTRSVLNTMSAAQRVLNGEFAFEGIEEALKDIDLRLVEIMLGTTVLKEEDWSKFTTHNIINDTQIQNS